jgi:hypothetical protein
LLCFQFFIIYNSYKNYFHQIYILSISVPTTKKFLDKSEVEDLVKKNDKCLSFKKPACGKSAYWGKYQEVLINNVRQKYVICNDCRSVLAWIPSNGTGVMKKHSVGCSKTKLPPETQPKDANKNKNEFEIYLNSDLRLDENADLFEFWMQQRENLPQLFQLAKQVLIIPTSNTCVERMFSVSGATVTEKRTRLAIEKIDKMIFFNRNLSYLKSLHETNRKESLDDTSHPLFISNKRVLSTDLSSSSSATKRGTFSTNNEAMSSEQYEQTQLDDDHDDDDHDDDEDDEDIF